MMTTEELDSIDGAIRENFFVTADVEAKQASGGWAVVISGVLCAIDPVTSRERATGQGKYEEPLDAVLTCLYDGRVRAGQRVVVKTILGVAATAEKAKAYQILGVDDLESLGRELECDLWKMS